jgi:L-rhamnose isomerase
MRYSLEINPNERLIVVLHGLNLADVSQKRICCRFLGTVNVNVLLRLLLPLREQKKCSQKHGVPRLRA